jgi:hypothetical protein
MSARPLRQSSLGAGLVQGAYFGFRLRVARQFPWSLLQGDVNANLEALRAREAPPDEEVAHKLRHLLQSEYCRQDLLFALGLLSEASWTIGVVEQGNAKTSRLAQLHLGYGSNRVRARTQVSAFASLLAAEKSKKQIARLEGSAAKRESWTPITFEGASCTCGS